MAKGPKIQGILGADGLNVPKNLDEASVTGGAEKILKVTQETGNKLMTATNPDLRLEKKTHINILRFLIYFAKLDNFEQSEKKFIKSYIERNSLKGMKVPEIKNIIQKDDNDSLKQFSRYGQDYIELELSKKKQFENRTDLKPSLSEFSPIQKKYLYEQLVLLAVQDAEVSGVEKEFLDEVLNSIEDENIKKTLEIYSVAADLLAENTKNIKQLEQQSEELKTQNEEIKAQTEELRRKNKLISDSIKYAQELQKTVMSESLEKVGMKGFQLLMPKDKVSGDFYWTAKVGNKKVMVGADCTGHGIPGSFLSAMGINILDNTINTKKVTDPGLILKELDNSIKTMMKGEKKRQDSMDIVVVVYDEDDNSIEFSGTGNGAYIVSQNEKTLKQLTELGTKVKFGKPEEGNNLKIAHLKPDSKPIGNYPLEERLIKGGETEFSFNTIKLNLAKGDSVYLYSDGFQDQFGGEGVNGEKYGKGKFRQFLLKTASLNLDEQSEFIKKGLKKWQGDHEQTDDVLVMGFEV